MIEAMIAGQTDPAVLARLANRRIRATQEELREALRGRLTAHHRFLLKLHLGQIDALDRAIARIDEEVKSGLDSFREATQIVRTLPGLRRSQSILSEIGIDMSRYPTRRPSSLFSPACARAMTRAPARGGPPRCAKAHAGGKQPLPVRLGSGQDQGSYFRAQFHRLKARRDAKKAIGAVASSVLRTIYPMLKDGTLYQDLGADHFDRREKTSSTRRLVRRLENLGFAVQLTPPPA
jgi:transposase